MNACVAVFLGFIAQAPNPSVGTESPLTPRWAIGQELVYRGTIEETSSGQGVQFIKQYRLEARALVLDQPRPNLYQTACFTRLTLASAAGGKANAVSLRLELGMMDECGRFLPRRIHRPYGDFEGPESFEDGYLLELPSGGKQQPGEWNLGGVGEPPRTVRIVGMENQAGISCIKISEKQQSEEWETPRGDRPAWKLERVLWIQPRTGLVQKVERTLWGRPAAHREPTYRLATSYSLETQLRYEGQFLEDRRREVEQIEIVQTRLRALSTADARTDPAALNALIERVDQFLRQQAATPYRDALVRLRETALSRKQNHLPAPRVEAGDGPTRETLTVGQPAPDFAVRTWDGKETAGLRAWRGQPVLLAFFHPQSTSCPLVLPALERLNAQTHQNLKGTLVGMAMSNDEAHLRRCREQFNLTFTLCTGTSLRTSYEVSTTPYFVLVDANGRVAGIRTGWGPETAAELEGDLRRLAGSSR